MSPSDLATILDTLVRVSEALDDRADIRDGEDGQPEPNWAMSLGQDVDAAIAILLKAKGDL